MIILKILAVNWKSCDHKIYWTNALVSYMMSFYKIRSEIQGNITEPWNIGHSDLQIVWGHWQFETEQVSKIWGLLYLILAKIIGPWDIGHSDL